MTPRPDWYCEEVLSGKLSVDKLWEDERVLAFHHPRPLPTEKLHIVIIPKAHIGSLLAPEALDGALLVSVLTAVQVLAKEFNLDGPGFYLRVNAGSDGVTPHMHWHLYGPGIP